MMTSPNTDVLEDRESNKSKAYYVLSVRKV